MPPRWFSHTIGKGARSGFCMSGGVQLHFLAWNPEAVEKPALIFVHGYRAHAHYWDFIAPFFLDCFRVIALDLAGMGDSSSRSEYSAEGFARDITALIEQADLSPATVVGHSFGGARALRAAAERPELIARVVALDSICRFPDGDEPQPLQRPARLVIYPDFATARARFRLVPAQPCANEFLLQHVARHSLRQDQGGWRWKFDPALPAGPREPDAAEFLERIQAPVHYVRGQHSKVVSSKLALRIVHHLKLGEGPIIIPGAYHYLMLDQPLALIAMLRELMGKEPAFIPRDEP